MTLRRAYNFAITRGLGGSAGRTVRRPYHLLCPSVLNNQREEHLTGPGPIHTNHHIVGRPGTTWLQFAGPAITFKKQIKTKPVGCSRMRWCRRCKGDRLHDGFARSYGLRYSLASTIPLSLWPTGLPAMISHVHLPCSRPGRCSTILYLESGRAGLSMLHAGRTISGPGDVQRNPTIFRCENRTAGITDVDAGVVVGKDLLCPVVAHTPEIAIPIAVMWIVWRGNLIRPP